MVKGRSQPPPEVIAGRYRVDGRVGAGAIGVVSLATDLETGRRVAVKRFDPARLSSPRAAERLLRSARAAMDLAGEHVARVLGCGELDGGAPYVVTEYLEGTDLRAYVERRGPMSVKEAVKYLLQACEAVAEAHAAGIVHRDLKPQNLFLTFTDAGHPSIKVLDFGTHAVACGAEGEAALASSSMRDSLLYMAPEQLRSGGRVDERADLWSLGGVGYLLVRGAGPFEAEDPLQIVARVMDEAPPPLPAEIKADGLEGVLRRCMEKDPEQRFANVAELSLALSRFGGAAARRAAERVWELRSAPQPSAEEPPELPPEVPDVPDVPDLAQVPDLAVPSGPGARRPPSRGFSPPSSPGFPAPSSPGLSPRPSSEPAARPSPTLDLPGAPPESQPAPRPSARPSQAPQPSSPSERPRAAAAAYRSHPPAAEVAPRSRLRRILEIVAASTLALTLLTIWLVRGRILVISQGDTSASAKTGIAAYVVDVLHAFVDQRGARARQPASSPPSTSAVPSAPAPPPGTTAPAPTEAPGAGSAPPALTPPPGGWEYPPEVIYDEVERERRRQRELEAAARRGAR